MGYGISTCANEDEIDLYCIDLVIHLGANCSGISGIFHPCPLRKPQPQPLGANFLGCTTNQNAFQLVMSGKTNCMLYLL